MKYIKQFNNPLNAFSWCENIENNALEQVHNLMNHPIIKHIAIMPDCHCGYGMPIGGVIACENAIIPNAVGVDIGCGMCFVETDLDVEDITKKQLKELIGEIRKVVPVGFSHHQTEQENFVFDIVYVYPDLYPAIINKEIESAKKQLGTLGGGNHFIELQEDEKGKLCIMIHSGSRNLGFKIANEYHKKALALNEKYHSDIPDKELAFLPIDTCEAQEYIAAMNYALDFAKANRGLMMERIIKCVDNTIPDVKDGNLVDWIDIHHNYAALENHKGKNYWIHRKGAIRMRKGEIGIIPGSMGTASYIVEGLGNVNSLCSASHGAGRVMGRKEASRTLTLKEVDKAMEGIIYGRWNKTRKGTLDFGEAPQAYKDIDSVINAEKDLVKPIKKLKPLAVIKG